MTIITIVMNMSHYASKTEDLAQVGTVGKFLCNFKDSGLEADMMLILKSQSRAA
jgi:hypothetical protein